ncbi:MAG: A24 family peptidase C-terminal domain-containing protein [Methanosarcinaceae archaeon]|nr:A24 family peptidase C-terminal domain-containing protein [Methanosarcinaceae archaeon]
MQAQIEILTLFSCLPFLLYASYSDLKHRKVSNRVWKGMLAALFVFVLYEASHGGLPYIVQLSYSFFVIFILGYLFFCLGFFGGADAKALIVLSLLIPVYPDIQLLSKHFPLLGLPFHGLFAFTVFENALLFTACVPFGLFFYNLLHFSKDMLSRPFYMFVAFQVDIRSLRAMVEKGRALRLIERFEYREGKLKSGFAGRGIVLSPNILSKLEACRKKGLLKENLWITPRIPFILPISLGFLFAILLGDLALFLLLKVAF